MKIIDSNHISAEQISADICIIGAGPAGMTLAMSLKNQNLNIVVIESGGKRQQPAANDLNVLNLESNFNYRNGESKRARKVGGTASLWAGRAVPYKFYPEFDQEWGRLSNSVVPFYDKAFELLKIDPAIQKSHKHSDREVYGYWAFNTQRFTPQSVKPAAENCRIFTNLTFTGQSEFQGDLVSKMKFMNHQQLTISVTAARFVFAMGAIENIRMLLIMEHHLKKRMGQCFKNVGKYLMDHPRVSHGTLKPTGAGREITRFQMKTTKYGLYKIGLRNHPSTSRVYSNIKRVPDRVTRRIMRIPLERFQYSSKKLFLSETGPSRTAVNQLKSFSLIRDAKYVSKWIERFVNNARFNEYRLMTYVEQRPRLVNKICLDEERDKYNLRIPRLCNFIHKEEMKEVFAFYRHLESVADSLNCEFEYNKEFISNPENYTDASHIMGGTRYSADLSKTVVDENLSLIGVPNLHITGSSVFPTSSVENPTHLISSLSLYLAKILEGKLKV